MSQSVSAAVSGSRAGWIITARCEPLKMALKCNRLAHAIGGCYPLISHVSRVDWAIGPKLSCSAIVPLIFCPADILSADLLSRPAACGQRERRFRFSGRPHPAAPLPILVPLNPDSVSRHNQSASIYDARP